MTNDYNPPIGDFQPADPPEQDPGDRLDAMLTEAYAEGRKDQAAEDSEMLAWAYRKLVRFSYSDMDDALMLDRINLLLQGAQQ